MKEKNQPDDWKNVQGYITSAIDEVALGAGKDQELRDAAWMFGMQELPPLAALYVLNELNPGSANTVLTRAKEMQKEARRGWAQGFLKRLRRSR
jgi:hypothetical protein